MSVVGLECISKLVHYRYILIPILADYLDYFESFRLLKIILPAILKIVKLRKGIHYRKQKLFLVVWTITVEKIKSNLGFQNSTSSKNNFVIIEAIRTNRRIKLFKTSMQFQRPTRCLFC